MIICYWNGTSKLNSPGVLDLLTPKVDSYPSDFLSSVPREVLHPWQCHHGSPSRPGTVPLWSLAVPWRRTSNARADSIIHENQTMELCSEWRVNFWYAGGVPTFLSLVSPKPGLPQSGKWHRTSKSHWMGRLSGEKKPTPAVLSGGPSSSRPLQPEAVFELQPECSPAETQRFGKEGFSKANSL